MEILFKGNMSEENDLYLSIQLDENLDVEAEVNNVERKLSIMDLFSKNNEYSDEKCNI